MTTAVAWCGRSRRGPRIEPNPLLTSLRIGIGLIKPYRASFPNSIPGPPGRSRTEAPTSLTSSRPWTSPSPKSDDQWVRETPRIRIHPHRPWGRIGGQHTRCRPPFWHTESSIPSLRSEPYPPFCQFDRIDLRNRVPRGKVLHCLSILGDPTGCNSGWVFILGSNANPPPSRTRLMGLELDLPSGQSLEQRLFPSDLNDPVGR